MFQAKLDSRLFMKIANLITSDDQVWQLGVHLNVDPRDIGRIVNGISLLTLLLYHLTIIISYNLLDKICTLILYTENRSIMVRALRILEVFDSSCMASETDKRQQLKSCLRAVKLGSYINVLQL